MESAREALIQEFEEDEVSCFDAGRLNNITDIALTCMAILTSLAATVLLTSRDDKHGWVLAILAAMPAACTAIQKTVDFRGRSNWYFHHAASLKSLAVSLRYAKTPDLERFAGLRAQLEMEGEARWTRIGRQSGSEFQFERPNSPPTHQHSESRQ